MNKTLEMDRTMDSQPQHTMSDVSASNTRGVMFMIQEIQKVEYNLWQGSIAGRDIFRYEPLK